MSLAKEAAGSFLWATAAAFGARLLSVVSTFLLTRYLSPAVQGEVNLAYVFVSSAGIATALGVAQYVASRPDAGRSAMFHGSVLLMGAGLLSCLFSLAAAPAVAGWLGTPRMTDYVPGLVLAHFIDRCGWVPRSMLVRQMRFRALGLRIAAGELTFAVSSVVLAGIGIGGHAIVWGNIARSTVGLLLLLATTGLREHLSPCRLEGRTFRAILSFGLPITVSQFFRLGATSWDNSFIGARFGEAAVGVYNQAYRLAELPAQSVGDQLNDVLVPTFARVRDAEARRRAFRRVASLLALLVLPMAAGLALTARSLVVVFYPPAYQGVAPFLAVLAVLSVSRCFTSLAGAFLQAAGRTRRFALNDILLVVFVLALMALFAPQGAVFSAAGVAIAFLGNTLLMLQSLRPAGITLSDVLSAVARPLLALAPMAAAVVALRLGLASLGTPPALSLAAEIACGTAVYSAAAWLLAPAIARDFLALARTTLARRNRPVTPVEQDGDGGAGV